MKLQGSKWHPFFCRIRLAAVMLGQNGINCALFPIFFCVCPPNVCKLCIFLCLPRLREQTWSGLGSGREAVQDLGLAQAFAALQGLWAGLQGPRLRSPRRVVVVCGAAAWGRGAGGCADPPGEQHPPGGEGLVAALSPPYSSATQPCASCCLGLYAGNSIGIFCLGPTWQHCSRSI